MTSPLDSLRRRRTTLVHKICHQVPLCNLWAFPQKLGITKFRHGTFLLVFLKNVVAKNKSETKSSGVFSTFAVGFARIELTKLWAVGV